MLLRARSDRGFGPRRASDTAAGYGLESPSWDINRGERRLRAVWSLRGLVHVELHMHEEVRPYGIFVDPDCMKCTDRLSVCPNGRCASRSLCRSLLKKAPRGPRKAAQPARNRARRNPSAEKHFECGGMLAEAGKLEETAIDQLSAARRLSPEDPDVFVNSLQGLQIGRSCEATDGVPTYATREALRRPRRRMPEAGSRARRRRGRVPSRRLDW